VKNEHRCPGPGLRRRDDALRDAGGKHPSPGPARLARRQIPPPIRGMTVNGNPVLTLSDTAGRLRQPSRNRPGRVAVHASVITTPGSSAIRAARRRDRSAERRFLPAVQVCTVTVVY
jgi:hypothetical protein